MSDSYTDDKMLTDLEAIGCDVKGALNRFMNRVDLYKKFLYKFGEEPTFSGLMEALDAGNLEEAFRCAHTLKGVAGNLGLDNLLHEVSPLVEALRRGEEPDKTQVESCTDEYKRIICVISAK